MTNVVVYTPDGSYQLIFGPLAVGDLVTKPDEYAEEGVWMVPIVVKNEDDLEIHRTLGSVKCKLLELTDAEKQWVDERNVTNKCDQFDQTSYGAMEYYNAFNEQPGFAFFLFENEDGRKRKDLVKNLMYKEAQQRAALTLPIMGNPVLVNGWKLISFKWIPHGMNAMLDEDVSMTKERVTSVYYDKK